MVHNYLDDLNKAQYEAVVSTEGPALVIAGAGAGKTRVLTYRIAYLLQKGVPAGRILALTFTNKAAREMKERIAGIAGPEITRFLWMGTFHSIFARILRIEGDRMGYKSNYTIYDTTDSRSLIRGLIRELNLDDNTYKPGIIASRISAAKNNLVTASMYAADSLMQENDKASRIPMMAEIFRLYTSRCFRANAMDFDDLLLNTNILFRDFPDALAMYREKFLYILVDEYQDTNYAQYLIVKKLAAGHNNLCVVGDDAQSIYSFRGARIENILEFKNDYTDYKLFKLEQNYRSTQTIVDAANGIIANNKGQIHKKVYSKNEPGEKIALMRAMTDTEEGLNVGSDILDKHLRLRLNWSDFAVLYRTNAQSRIFEETLRRKDIPYKVYGGLSFYERKEIKDILAYFRMVINPDDDEALKRSVNYPKRGIGETTVEKIFALASEENKTAWDILSSAAGYPVHFNSGTLKKLSVYAEMIDTLAKDADTTDAFTKAGEIAHGSGIIGEFRGSKLPEDISRMENLEELLNAIKIFTEGAGTNGEPSTLGAYLATVALLTDQDNEKEEGRDKVTLMTMHSAKGLEFNCVYIAGMEDTLFPSPMSNGSAGELEEERRLFYVALTRAKKHAILSYALNRYKWGNLERCRPSRFLREVEPGFLAHPQTGGKQFDRWLSSGSIVYGSSEESSSYNFRRKITKITKPAHQQVASGNDPTSAVFREGDKVRHERFGDGLIVTIEGSPPNATASVEFEKEGRKKLLLRFAKLKKI